MTPDFQLFEAFRRHHVPFVIIGGHAVNFHGYIRATEDTDILWARCETSEANLFAALVELKAEFIDDEIDPNTNLERTHPISLPFLKSRSLMMLCTRYGFLDIFDYVPGLPELHVSEVFDSAVEVNGLRFASLRCLRQMKRASARPKDLLDLVNLPEEETLN
jgi:hypothetical protein